MSTNKISIDIIEDVAGFEALKDEWHELLSHCVSDCLFLTWEWLFTWWKYFSADCQLHIIAVRLDSKLIAIAPFTLRSRRWKRLLPFPILEFLGTGSVGSDYLDILVRQGCENRVHSVLADYFAQEEHMFSLPSVDRNIAQVCAFARRIALRGWSARHIVTDICPYIDLAGLSWETYISKLGTTHRHNLRQRTKKLQKKWDTHLELVQTEQERPEALRMLMSLHCKRWRTRDLPGAFHDPAVVVFHEEVSQRMLALGRLRLYILRLNGEPAAAIYGFLYNSVFYYYQSGFDPEYQKYSVGLVAMGFAIHNAIDEHAMIFDFLRGNESYKALWARNYRELIRLELYPAGFRGALYRKTMQLRSNIRNITFPDAEHVTSFSS